MAIAILYSSHSLSRLSKLSIDGSALRYFTPIALPNSNIFLFASWFLVNPDTPNPTGVTSYSLHSSRIALSLSGVLSSGMCFE